MLWKMRSEFAHMPPAVFMENESSCRVDHFHHPLERFEFHLLSEVAEYAFMNAAGLESHAERGADRK